MDHLWPEPVVRVQAISEAGTPVIPERYVKPPSERPSPDTPVPHLSIPVIDLGAPVGGAQAIPVACREWGFFQIVNHGVSLELVRRVRDVWRDFFHLPIEAKEAYGNSPVTYEGYGSRVGVEKGAVLDWGDYYFLHLMPESSKWPMQSTYCREVTVEYGIEVMKLCKVLLRVLSSLGLGMEEDFMEKAFGGEEMGCCLRVNYYPKCPQPELTLGLSAHSDPGGLTVLLPDERVNGLQVKKGDVWVNVDPLPNAFVINVGDQIQVLSNGTFKSVEHRVVANAAEERLSLALFCNPRTDLLLGPAMELVTPERPLLYQSMTFSEYRMYIRKNGPKGKAQVESLKAV
ncbi:jasmonate-induced oxygenase 1-like [Typha latifolia]|uniref:jasmonate-induced oxygenase 1-like n=1 Tax=Typha latifolia TaxID=4733 RepID=UPI003C2ECF6A